MTLPFDWFMAHCMTKASNRATTDLNVSRETFSLLSDYVALLLKWNAKINLIGPLTEADVWSRHVDDSRQLVSCIPPSATSLADLGSGAGLPGLILAIMRPDLSVTLVEQDQRKAAFLNEAKRLLQLSNVKVEAVNILALTQHYDVITARALAPLTQLLAYSAPLLKKDGAALFLKGANHAAELAEAKAHWAFAEALTPSITHADSAIIHITQLQHISSQNR